MTKIRFENLTLSVFFQWHKIYEKPQVGSVIFDIPYLNIEFGGRLIFIPTVISVDIVVVNVWKCNLVEPKNNRIFVDLFREAVCLSNGEKYFKRLYVTFNFLFDKNTSLYAFLFIETVLFTLVVFKLKINKLNKIFNVMHLKVLKLLRF